MQVVVLSVTVVNPHESTMEHRWGIAATMPTYLNQSIVSIMVRILMEFGAKEIIGVNEKSS
jgi:hypothetical protein